MDKLRIIKCHINFVNSYFGMPTLQISNLMRLKLYVIVAAIPESISFSERRITQLQLFVMTITLH